MPGGRPTVATPENVERARAYVEECAEKGTLPTVEQLSFILGISRDSLYARDEFSDILERLKQLQAFTLIIKGLEGDYSAVIAKLLLSSKHGYVEKSEVKTDNPIAVLLKEYGVDNEGESEGKTP